MRMLGRIVFAINLIASTPLAAQGIIVMPGHQDAPGIGPSGNSCETRAFRAYPYSGQSQERQAWAQSCTDAEMVDRMITDPFHNASGGGSVCISRRQGGSLYTICKY